MDAMVLPGLKQKGLMTGILLLAVALVLISTHPHVGADPDTTVYVGVAKNWAAGRGLTMPILGVPLTHYPPLYPLILSPGLFLGLDVLRWALGLSVVMLVANTLLAGAIVSRLGTTDVALPVFLVSFSPGILTVYWMAWSEPLLIFLGFSGLLIIDAYLRNHRVGFLLLGALAMALAWLDRYIGIAFIVGAGTTLWLHSRSKMRDMLLFGFISVAPMAVWLADNAARVGNPVNRTLALRPITLAEGSLLVFELIAAGALYVFLKRRTSGVIQQMLALTIFAHTAVVAFTACLVDAHTPVLDTRIQVVVMYAGLLLLPWLAQHLRPRMAVLFGRLLIVLAAVQLTGAAYYAGVAFNRGLEYSDGRWAHGDLVIPAHPWDDPG